MNKMPTDDLPKILQGKNYALLIYVFYCLSYFTGGLTAVIGVAMAYAKSHEQDELLQSHYKNQIKIFWYSVLWITVGFMTIVVLVGWFILLGGFIWSVIQIIKGIVKLNDGVSIIK